MRRIFVFPGSRPWPWLSAPVLGPGAQFVYTSPGFVFASFFVLQSKFALVSASTYTNPVSTYMYLLLKYNVRNK